MMRKIINGFEVIGWDNASVVYCKKCGFSAFCDGFVNKCPLCSSKDKDLKFETWGANKINRWLNWFTKFHIR